MAILRGGRRIGNYDIRIGMPRDKSLVDIHKDPRLQRQPGGAGTIQRFLAQVNQGEGFARTNRYIVRVNLPRPIAEPVDEEQGFGINEGGNNDYEDRVGKQQRPLDAGVYDG